MSVQGTDLASVAGKVQKLVDEIRPKLPRGSQVTMRGQVETMQASFIGLGVGLAMAIVLVYLLIVVNFQSWIDAAIIIAALPAALAGIAWMLFITGTTLSVPALTGAIMMHGRGDREQHPAGLVRARARMAEGVAPLRGRARRRRDAHPAGADDGARDDHRHDPDGARHRRRRRAERAARPRGHRRPAVRDRLDAVLRAGRVTPASTSGCAQRQARARPARARTPVGGAHQET